MNKKNTNIIFDDTMLEIRKFLDEQGYMFGEHDSSSFTQGFLYCKWPQTSKVVVDEEGTTLLTFSGITALPENIDAAREYCGNCRLDIGSLCVDDDGSVYHMISVKSNIDINTFKVMDLYASEALNIHSSRLNRIAHGLDPEKSSPPKECKDWTSSEIFDLNKEESSIYNINVSRVIDLLNKSKHFNSLVHFTNGTADCFVADSLELLVGEENDSSIQFRSVLIARCDRKHGFLRIYSLPGPDGILGESPYRYSDVPVMANAISASERFIMLSGNAPLGCYCAYIDIPMMIPLNEELFSCQIHDLSCHDISHRHLFEKVANGIPVNCSGDSCKRGSPANISDIASIDDLKDAVANEITSIISRNGGLIEADESEPSDSESNAIKLMSLFAADKTELC